MLYLVGDNVSPDWKTTEELNITGQQAWNKSFDLQSAVSLSCTVATSKEDIVTIAGYGENNKWMYKYNVRTGDAVQYNTAPTPV